MRKYKLFKKQFEVWKHYIYLLPTIAIMTDEMVYTRNNFSICFHWLVWHGRLVYLEDSGEDLVH